MSDLNDNKAVKAVIEYLAAAPKDLSDTLTRLYGDWCRRQPTSFGPLSDSNIRTPVLPQDIQAYAHGFEKVLRQVGRDFEIAFPSVLMSDYGLELLWSMHEARGKDSLRALYSYLPILAPLEHIRRGGINVYKRFSWTMHVMIVSRVLWSDLPAGNLPPTIAWPESTRKAMRRMRLEYLRLEDSEIRLLRLACVIHDIGVRDGVQDHDKKGIRYVEGALQEMGGTNRISDLIGGLLSPDETLVALRALVGEHTLASKVNGEEGPAHVRADLDRWLDFAPAGSRLRRFLEKSFSRLLGSFLICDIVGVADELLTAPTINRAAKSISSLSEIISSGEIGEQTIEGSAERLGVMIGVESSDEVMAIMRTVFRDESDVSQILREVGAAELLDYAMGILKPLKEPAAAIAIMASLISQWKSLEPSVSSRPLELRFSPHCELDSVARWGDALLASTGNGTWKDISRVPPSQFGIVVETIGESPLCQLYIRTENEQA